MDIFNIKLDSLPRVGGERGGSVVECRTPEREVRGSRPTSALLCPWARHFTPRKYWLITQEAMAPSRHDWKIVDWDVKPQHNQPIKHNSWLSGRVSDSGARGPGFETYLRPVVSLSKTLYSPKVLVNYPGSDGSVPTWLKNCWQGR